jgi:hypothetical protein
LAFGQLLQFPKSTTVLIRLDPCGLRWRVRPSDGCRCASRCHMRNICICQTSSNGPTCQINNPLLSFSSLLADTLHG